MGNFTKYLNSRFFLRTFGNTLIISFMRLTLEAPIPIILALLLNEVRIVKFKKTVQDYKLPTVLPIMGGRRLFRDNLYGRR